jgi:hypothetical protein
MPKDAIDYSNTIIYKIFCKDKQVTDTYVGHTTNFTKRKGMHKASCNSGRDLKIYNIIRANGGWDNWEMIEIAKYDCKDSTEARIKEQEHYDLLNASLNINPPYVNPKNYYCEICNRYCAGPKDFENHNISQKHTRFMETFLANKQASTMLKSSEPESSSKYNCELCEYSTSRKSQYDRHLDTSKHQKMIQSTFCQQSSTIINQESSKLVCECGKEYKERSGLWRHKKVCDYKPEPLELNSTNINDISGKDLILMLIKENKELQSLLVEHAREYKDDIKNMMMEVLKNGTNNTTNTNTNTNCMNNNKTFNLQFFLNETCKDAMNINDFVDSIKVQLCDLERFGEIGYVENLSNIITTNLKALDVTERPVHCTDKKRETIYIKDEDKWEKEDDNKSRLRKAIKKIASKNYKLLPEYREKYPGCQYADSKYSDRYNKMVVEAMCGNGNEAEKEDKIIRNISKNVTIDKQ